MTITRATAQNALVALLGVALVLHVDRRLGQLERESAQQPLTKGDSCQNLPMADPAGRLIFAIKTGIPL
jgi:hypothetical protein